MPGLSDVMRKLSLDVLESDSDHVDPEISKSVSTVSTVEGEISKLSFISPPEKPKVVWEHTSNFQTFTEYQNSDSKVSDLYHHHDHHQHNLRRSHHHSEPSSVPTTSDEETLERPKRCVGGSDGDTSTMESAQMVADRAKSFEYIPGETFNMQENSSSYEYLPGHLVEPDNRPPTVLNNLQSAAALPDNFDTVDNAKTKSLDLLSTELRDKSKDLMAKNISQTKHFFKKLKSYIEYLSTPSLTVEDSRVKQELAGVNQELAGVKKDVVGVKKELAGVNQELAGVKKELAGVKKEQFGVRKEQLKQEPNQVKSEYEQLQNSMDFLMNTVMPIEN